MDSKYSIILLTSGTNGGSTIPASKRFQLIQLKKGCNLTSLAPKRPLRQPKRNFIDLASNCWHNDLASSLNLLEYFSGSSYLTKNKTKLLKIYKN